ncbi:MAG TPA: phenylalanine--tRNA ligase beta subunit-related protein [Ktedonobacteraceae bacterium]|nr:phenylalanine--tRNA ligase beta subunit-related protein [Ktedonobacteraceae bacterium]
MGKRQEPERQEGIMAYQLIVDDQIFEQFPGYQALIVYAEGIQNFPSTEEGTALLHSAEQECRAKLTLDTLALHPHIVAWRDAYRQFGAKPKKYASSVEALLLRTLKGQDIPTINGLVDLYNALSLKYILPVGGEDWNKLVGVLHLTFAQGSRRRIETVLVAMVPILYRNGRDVEERIMNWYGWFNKVGCQGVEP